MLYFAYGSNMNLSQMKDRCPCARFLKRGFIKGYKFVYDGYSGIRRGAVANIIPSENSILWGAVFEITKECLSQLDDFEGYPNAYARQEFEVWDDNSEPCNAIAYLRVGRTIAKPNEDYEQIILRGAKDCNLPEEYVSEFLKTH
jgi:gamma-glutamylcyclotransferase (GGCT)/AIG2-like uncharacterized protein YtfP